MLSSANGGSKATHSKNESNHVNKGLLQDCWNAIEQLESLEESERANEKEISDLIKGSSPLAAIQAIAARSPRLHMQPKTRNAFPSGHQKLGCSRRTVQMSTSHLVKILKFRMEIRIV